jgi:hypothetical protein
MSKIPQEQVQQFLDPSTPNRRDNAKLGKIRTDGVDHRGLLAHEQMARAMEHQTALLFRGLGWHKSHISAGDRFTNCLASLTAARARQAATSQCRSEA